MSGLVLFVGLSRQSENALEVRALPFLITIRGDFLLRTRLLRERTRFVDSTGCQRKYQEGEVLLGKRV